MQGIELNPTQLALSLRNAAKAIDVSVITLRREIAKGRITPVRKLRTLLIATDELRRWLSNN